MLNKIKKVLSSVALIKQIAVGLVIGILIAVFTPTVIPVVKIFGDLFVKALKGVAPVLVFFLVMNAMAQKKEGTNANMKPISSCMSSEPSVPLSSAWHCHSFFRPYFISRWQPMPNWLRLPASLKYCTM